MDSFLAAAAIRERDAHETAAERPHMPPERSVTPPAEAIDKWEEYGGLELEPVLQSGAVALLEATWIVRHMEAGGTLRRRQDLPPEAFITLDELRAIGHIPAPPTGVWTASLPIIIISYPWLTPEHPDPNRAWLQRVGTALKGWTKTKAQTPPRYGVMWDFVSLHQHPTGGERYPSETALFKQALDSLGSFYAHPSTIVWRLTVFPDGYPGDGYWLPKDANVSEYFSRGWCFTESCWSSLSKNRDLSLDLGLYNMKVVRRAAIVKQCTQGGGRCPPLLPDQFALEIDAKAFTNGKDDRPLVTRLYRDYFQASMVKASRLDSSRLDWCDTEACQLARVLPELQGLETLDLSHNSLGRVGGAAIASALQVNRAALKSINLRANSLGTEGWCAIFHALRDNQENKFESWDLSGEDINPEIAKALAEYISVSVGLTSLNLSSNRLSGVWCERRQLKGTYDASGIQALASALAGNSTITNLDLSLNQLDAEAGKALAEALQSGTSAVLTTCTLIKNKLGFDSATMLAKIGTEKRIMLSGMKRDQTEVDFFCQGLQPADAILIASDLPFMAVLTKLNLYFNDIGWDGVKALAEALRVNSVLKSIMLSFNPIEDEGAIAIGECLKTNSTLETLELQQCGIGAAGGKAIGEAIQFGTTALKSIDLRDNSFGTDGAQVLRDAVKDRSDLQLHM